MFRFPSVPLHVPGREATSSSWLWEYHSALWGYPSVWWSLPLFALGFWMLYLGILSICCFCIFWKAAWVGVCFPDHAVSPPCSFCSFPLLPGVSPCLCPSSSSSAWSCWALWHLSASRAPFGSAHRLPWHLSADRLTHFLFENTISGRTLASLGLEWPS